MINTANLKASLKDLEEIRDTATAAIAPLRELLDKLSSAGIAAATATPPIGAKTEAPATPAGEVSPNADETKKKGYADSIQYSDELTAWLETQEGPFTIATFHDFLAAKYGEEKVNDQSIRNPFRRLAKAGTIVTVREPSGRSPAVFRSAKSLSVEKLL